MRKFLLVWLVVWVVVGAGVAAFVKDRNVLYGVGVAAAISLVTLLKTLGESWSGEVVDIRRERIDTSTGDGDPTYEEMDMAYLKLTNGKTKRVRAVRGWTIGTKVEKKRGEAAVN